MIMLPIPYTLPSETSSIKTYNVYGKLETSTAVFLNFFMVCGPPIKTLQHQWLLAQR